jgi:hypothetical protein
MLIQLPIIANYPRLTLRRHPPRNTQAIELGSHTEWACHREVRDNVQAEKDVAKWVDSHSVYDYSKPTPVGATIRLSTQPRDPSPPRRRAARTYPVQQMIPIIKDKIMHPIYMRPVRVWHKEITIRKWGASPMARANRHRLFAGFKHTPWQKNTITEELMVPDKPYFHGVTYKENNESPCLVLEQMDAMEVVTEAQFDDLMDALVAAEKSKPKRERELITTQYVIDVIQQREGLQHQYTDEYGTRYFGVMRTNVQDYGVDGREMVHRDFVPERAEG